MRMLHAAGTWRRAGAALLALTLATPLPGAAAWFDGDEKRLAAEADRFVADKPAELQRILHTLYMEGEWNAVLNLDLLGLAAIEAGRPRLAERAFDMAAARILRMYADDPNARQARSLWSAESVKDWKGEPYNGEHGGVANPSPWPAEPVEAGRERANAALRNQLLALPFGP
ncbi:hypothetical protein [Cupriavidus taiwanensis]|uniref:hypothetical protein n=1 Tax=Cupriavidus taiwanensis TaxID=164546 RepID=UPI000E185DB4|nr:hypothetical protein [Cupriavidus taiwanensis]SPC20286.1 conserved exported hypothetical protein [Cupriavidus taiwanensis]